ncbi:DNA-binding protein [Shewanella algae]|nr:DNA-binding protein [Shewanella algae]TVO97566.1 DNA-binding protein [Shewanella algae]
MLHTNNPIIKHKAGLLNLAEELGNVSRACKVMGVSRDTFYRYRELVEDGGYWRWHVILVSDNNLMT